MKDLDAPQRIPPANPRVLPPVGQAAWTKFHSFVFASLFVLFVVPATAVGVYMYAVANDQYVSEVSFVVRDEESQSLGLLAGFGLSSTSNASTDAQIIYKYLRSSNFVRDLNSNIDLRQIFTKPERDPIFKLKENSSLEELVRYWRKMITISVDSASGMTEIEVRAFTPQDAKRIAEGIHQAAGRLVNSISDDARTNALRYAQRDLVQTEGQLADARVALAKFRDKYKLIDPSAVVTTNATIVTALSQELTEAMVQLETQKNQGLPDVRVAQAEMRVDVLKRRLEEEQKSYVGGPVGDETFSTVVDRYTKLALDLELAEKSYSLALAGVEAARSKSQQDSRYLATFVQPTNPETATKPRRTLITALTTIFLFIGWLSLVLIGYSNRDRH